MNKAVLLSIQPKWCELIASGKKTVEVRKSAPKLETPFKCYIYMTKSGNNALEIVKKNGNSYVYSVNYHMAGKVIGEFVCDRIDEYRNYGFALRDENDEVFDVGQLLSNACLSVNELVDYIRGRSVFYAWHISELKIYDKPKELREFLKPCKWRVDNGWTNYQCEARSHKVGCQYAIEDRNPDGSVNDYICSYKDYVTRPPQSWMYIEEV